MPRGSDLPNILRSSTRKNNDLKRFVGTHGDIWFAIGEVHFYLSLGEVILPTAWGCPWPVDWSFKLQSNVLVKQYSSAGQATIEPCGGRNCA